MTTTSAIELAVREIDSYVARGGWDGPIRLFALINSSEALAANPELANQLPADVDLASAQLPETLFSVEQEDLPVHESVGDLLTQIAWPEAVAGAAISLECVTMPPDAEDEIPEDPDEAQRFVANDPRREDIRMVVGVTREGDSWCTMRLRSHDNDDEVLSSPDLVADMVEALRATFL